MTKITLNIPDTKLNFFLELVEQLGIEVSKNETDIPDWQKEIVRERLKNAKDENFTPWNEARKKLNFKTIAS